MKCEICEIGCRLDPGAFGGCQMYVNDHGRIVERHPDTYIAAIPISIETLPMTHFRPRAKFLQVGSIGCNFSCPGCVSGLFTQHPDHFQGAVQRHLPEEIVAKARALECEGIVYCMNDPVAAHHTFLRLARTARQAGLAVGCSTNGFHTPSALAELAEVVDFVNIGLKGGSNTAYSSCGAPASAPVFRNIRQLWEAGVHVEVSVMFLGGHENEVLEAAWRVGAISADIPFQVMRFVPFGNSSLDLEPSLAVSERLCRRILQDLIHVYLFNAPGTSFLDVLCPDCGATLIHREFFGPMGCRTVAMKPGLTCRCGYKAPIEPSQKNEPFQEQGMAGGYRFTRALEVIRAVGGCLGLDSGEEVCRVWQEVLAHDDVGALHDKINDIGPYLGLIREMGQRFGRESRAEALTEYLEDRVERILDLTRTLDRPKVYYCMATPFFALNAERFEIRLVEAAGGRCVNRDLRRSGKPGVNISKEEILSFNPDHIFISGLFSSSEHDANAICQENNLWVEAVNSGRIHSIPPGWDFGNPRWILGLMHMANILHPECFDFDLAGETDGFYRRFHGAPPERLMINRSFFQQVRAGAC